MPKVDYLPTGNRNLVFAIMLPIKLSSGDWRIAWQAGVAWVFIEGIVLFLGAFIAPTIRRLTPRAGPFGCRSPSRYRAGSVRLRHAARG